MKFAALMYFAATLHRHENDISALLEETPSLLEDDGDDDNELPSLVRIHHMRCAVHTL